VADDDLQRWLEANADLLVIAKPHLEEASSMTARRPLKFARWPLPQEEAPGNRDARDEGSPFFSRMALRMWQPRA
jgi:hypothetical protein